MFISSKEYFGFLNKIYTAQIGKVVPIKSNSNHIEEGEKAI